MIRYIPAALFLAVLILVLTLGEGYGGPRRDNLESAAPIDVISREDFENTDTVDIEDLVPQLQTADNPGNCLNLRGIGNIEPIRIGDSSQYGSGAASKIKVEDAAMGAASQALGGLLGGSGVSLGGGGGGNSDGPKTVKNPIRGLPELRFDFNEFDIGMRAGFKNDDFIVSQRIYDSPGDNSTFHATWLEDGEGRRILPKRLLIFSIYVDHKLTVWWTYDHWTNGVHDYHDEGEESFSWRTYHGNKFVRLFEGEEGVQNSIWYQSGFDTAVKGVRAIGAVYDIEPDMFMGGCPLTSVTHLTEPDQVPVLNTVPFIGELFRSEKTTGTNNLQVMITPHIVSAAD